MNFEVTELALAKIREFRPTHEHGIRIVVMGGGCSGLTYSMKWVESPEENDEILMDEDVLIFIEKKSSLFLNEAMLDYDEGLVSAGFKITGSKIKNSCGCGKSFGV
jgi:iron-sulfur cluster assembly protein